VSKVPGSGIRTASLPIVMTDIGCSRSVARPVIAVRRTHRKSAVHVGSGQDVVRVRSIATPVNHSTLLRQRVFLPQLVVGAMQVVHILRHRDALRVLPGAATDSVACINCRLIAAR
jgi:hypothetical protein